MDYYEYIKDFISFIFNYEDKQIEHKYVVYF